MINLEMIRNYFPADVRDNASFQKYMLKEYLQLAILDFLASTPYTARIVFIGGTNLRLVKGIDRWSENLDFDCKDFTREEFMEMTNSVLQFLSRSGFKVETRDRENKKLTAFRRSLYFPELLFKMGLSRHKEERFLIKIECEDQQIQYEPAVRNIKGCGFFFPFLAIASNAIVILLGSMSQMAVTITSSLFSTLFKWLVPRKPTPMSPTFNISFCVLVTIPKVVFGIIDNPAPAIADCLIKCRLELIFKILYC